MSTRSGITFRAPRVFAPQGVLALQPEAFGQAFDQYSAASAVEPQPTVACVVIRGPLLQHFDWMCQSYEAILQCVAAACASNARAVLMLADSPGGLVSGCFATARQIRALCDAAGKELYAYVDGRACSACYALASVADAIIVSDTSDVGSIGVIASVVEQTKLDSALGVKFTILTSGARKADGNPHLELSPEAAAALQANLDTVATLFYDFVAEQRGMSAEAVRALEAASFLGKASIDAGLADAMLDLPEFLAAIAAGPFKTGEKTMSYREGVKALEAVEKDKDATEEEKANARKMLDAIKAAEDKDPPKDDEDNDEKKDKAVKAEDKKDDEDKEDKKEAASSTPATAAAGAPAVSAESADSGLLALAAVHTMQIGIDADRAEKLKADRKAKRSALLASRPDFAPELRAKLEVSKLEIVEHYCATLPKGSTATAPVTSALAASQASPTMQGAPGPDGGTMSPRLQALLAKNGVGQVEKPPAVLVLDAGAGMQAQTFSVLGQIGKRSIVTELPTPPRG